MSNQNNESGAPTGEQDLGLAGGIAKAFIQSPLSPLLFFAFLFLGIMGLILTPRQEDPQISVPMIDIMIMYPGASVNEVATKAIDPLERIMSEIPGVEHVYSASMRGQGVVTVQFFVGEEMGPSLVKLHDKMQSNMDKMPDGVMKPLVKPKGIDDVAVVNLTLWSKDADQDGIEDVDDATLRVLALDVLQSLKEIPDTGQGFVVGGRSEQIQVLVRPDRLTGYGISLGQVANTIKTHNARMDARGTGIEMDGSTIRVQTGKFIESADDIRKLVIGNFNGSMVYIRDIAEVIDKPEETKQMVQYYTGAAYKGKANSRDGMPAVTISVAKKEGSNGVNVANAILAKVEKLKVDMIPGNVEVAVTRNYGATAKDKVDDLIKKLFKATGFVVILVWLAFLALKPAFVVMLVIPVVILFTVFMAFLMGYSIDRVSLFALIFSIGILVDDAIVVVENIYRRWLEEGNTDPDVAVDAVREVGNPTILATFTVIAALLPMGFVRGMMGPYMEPIPALGSVAMLFSLLAAFMFTPWLALKYKPTLAYLKKAEAREHHQAEQMDRMFRGILIPLIDNGFKRLLFKTIMWGSLMLCFVMFYTTAVKVKMLPLDNKPEFSVVINMPEGTGLALTANLAHQMASKMRALPEVIDIQSYIGTARPFDFNGMVRHYYLRREAWQGELQIQLTHKNERERTSHDLALVARDWLTPMAHKLGARISVVEMPPGPPVLQTVVAEIHGPSRDGRKQVAADLFKIFEDSPNVTDVDDYIESASKYKRFVVDSEKSSRLGVSVSDINQNIVMAMGGFVAGTIKGNDALEQKKIIIQIPIGTRSETSVYNLPIMTSQGTIIPLAELGEFVDIDIERTIFHKDLREIDYVVGEVTGELAAPIYGMLQIKERLENYTGPDGKPLEDTWLGPPDDDSTYAFEWGGEWTVTYQTFRDMGLAFCVALILIYILVVWEFGNFRVPGIIMAPIPLTLLGIIPGHWMLNAEFTATSMIGWIALAGIIVRNSILLVDYSVHEVAKGVTVREAVLMSCKTRTRPIVITAFALVCGSSVIITDPIFNGMAISLMFGVLVSTVLTLIVIPLGCMGAASDICTIAGIEKEGMSKFKADNDAGSAAPATPASAPVQASAEDKPEVKVVPKPAAKAPDKPAEKAPVAKVPAKPAEKAPEAKPAVKAEPAAKPAAAKKKTVKKKVAATKKAAVPKKKAAPIKKDATASSRRGIRLKDGEEDS